MQTQTEDLTDDDAIGDVPTVSRDDLAKQFVNPGYTFKGLKLAPYTASRDILFNQIFDRNDSPQTIFLSFIFVHVSDRDDVMNAKGEVIKPGMISLCWDKPKFRAAFLDWVDSIGPITKEEHVESMNLFEEIRGWANKSTVEVVPDPDLPEKKTKAKRRHTSHN